MESQQLKSAGAKQHAIADRNNTRVAEGKQKAEVDHLAQKLLEGTLAGEGEDAFGASEMSQTFETVSNNSFSPKHSNLSPNRAGGGGGLAEAAKAHMDNNSSSNRLGHHNHSMVGGGDNWVLIERSRLMIENNKKLAEKCFERLRESLTFQGFPIDEDMKKSSGNVRGIDLEQFLQEARRRRMTTKPYFKSNMDLHERNALFESEVESTEVKELLEPDVDIEEAVKELGQRLGLIAPDGGWKSRCNCEHKLDIIKHQVKTDERRIARAKFMTAFTRELDRVVGYVDEYVTKCNEAEDVRQKEIIEIRERQYAMITKTQLQKQTIDRLRKATQKAGLKVEEDPNAEKQESMDDMTKIQGYRTFMNKEKQKSKVADVPKKKVQRIKKRLMQYCANSEKALMAKCDFDGYVDPYLEEYLEKVRAQKRDPEVGCQTLTDDELAFEHGIFVGSNAGGLGGGKRGTALKSISSQLPVPKPAPLPVSFSHLTAEAPEQGEGIPPPKPYEAEAHSISSDAIRKAQAAETSLAKMNESVLKQVELIEGFRSRIMSSVASLAPAESELEKECTPLFTFANNGTKDAIHNVYFELNNASKGMLHSVKDLLNQCLNSQKEIVQLKKDVESGQASMLQQQESMVINQGNVSFAQHVEDVRGEKEPASPKKGGSKASMKKSGSKKSVAAEKSPPPPPREASPEPIAKKESTAGGAKKPSMKKGSSKKEVKGVAAEGSGGEGSAGAAPASKVDFSALKAQLDDQARTIQALRNALIEGTKLLQQNDRLDLNRKKRSSEVGEEEHQEEAESKVAGQQEEEQEKRMPAEEDDLLTMMAPTEQPGQQPDPEELTVLKKLELCEADNYAGLVELAKGWVEEYLPAVGYRIADPDATVPLIECCKKVRRAAENVVNACTKVGFSFPMETILDIDRFPDFSKMTTVSHVIEQMLACSEHVSTAGQQIKKEMDAIIREEQRPLGETMEVQNDACRKLMATIQELFPDIYIDDPVQQFLDSHAAKSMTRRQSVLAGAVEDELFSESEAREQGRMCSNAAISLESGLRDFIRIYHQRQDEEIERRVQKGVTEVHTKMVEQSDKLALQNNQKMTRARQEVEDRIRQESEKMKQILAEEEARMEQIRQENEKRVQENEEQTQRAIQLQEELKELRTQQAQTETTEAIEAEASRLHEAQEELFREMMDSLTINEYQNRSGVDEVEETQWQSLVELMVSVLQSLKKKEEELAVIEAEAAAAAAAATRTPSVAGNKSSMQTPHAAAIKMESLDIEEEVETPEHAEGSLSASDDEDEKEIDEEETTTTTTTTTTEMVDGVECISQGLQVKPSCKSRSSQTATEKPAKKRSIGVHCVMETLSTPAPPTPPPPVAVVGEDEINENDEKNSQPNPGKATVAHTQTSTDEELLAPLLQQLMLKNKALNTKDDDDDDDDEFEEEEDPYEEEEEEEKPVTEEEAEVEEEEAEEEEEEEEVEEEAEEGTGKNPSAKQKRKSGKNISEMLHEEYMASIGNALPIGYVCKSTETDYIPPTMQMVSFMHNLPKRIRPVHSGAQTALSATSNESGTSVASDGQSGALFFSTLNDSQMDKDEKKKGGVSPSLLEPSSTAAHRVSSEEIRASTEYQNLQHEIELLNIRLQTAQQGQMEKSAAATPQEKRAVAASQVLTLHRHAQTTLLDLPALEKERTCLKEELASWRQLVSNRNNAEAKLLCGLEAMLEAFGSISGGPEEESSSFPSASSALAASSRKTSSSFKKGSQQKNSDENNSFQLDIDFWEQKVLGIQKFFQVLAKEENGQQGSFSTNAGESAAEASVRQEQEQARRRSRHESVVAASAAVSQLMATCSVGVMASVSYKTDSSQTDPIQFYDAEKERAAIAAAVQQQQQQQQQLLQKEAAEQASHQEEGILSPSQVGVSVTPAKKDSKPASLSIISPSSTAHNANSNLLSPSVKTPRAQSANRTGDEMWERKIEAAVKIAEEEKRSFKKQEAHVADQLLVMHRLMVDTLKELVKRIQRDDEDSSGPGASMVAVMRNLSDPFTNLHGVFSASSIEVINFDTNLLSTLHRHLRMDSSLSKKRISMNLEQAALNKKLERLTAQRKTKMFGATGSEVPQMAAFLDRQEEKLRKAIAQFAKMKEEIAQEKMSQFYLPQSDVVEVASLPHMHERRRLAGIARAQIRTPIEGHGQVKQVGKLSGPSSVGDYEHQLHPGNSKKIRFNPLSYIQPSSSEQQLLQDQSGVDLKLNIASFHSPNSKPPLPPTQGMSSSPSHQPGQQGGELSVVGEGSPSAPGQWKGGLLREAQPEPEEKPIDVIMRTSVLQPKALPSLNDPLVNARAPPVKHLVVPKRTTQVQPDRDFFASYLHGHAASLKSRTSPPPNEQQPREERQQEATTTPPPPQFSTTKRQKRGTREK